MWNYTNGLVENIGMTKEERTQRIKKIRVLYPRLTDEECLETADNLDRYILLAWEIFMDLEEGKGEIKSN